MKKAGEKEYQLRIGMRNKGGGRRVKRTEDKNMKTMKEDENQTWFKMWQGRREEENEIDKSLIKW